jgi:predicted MFS family arabinose efflux permease
MFVIGALPGLALVPLILKYLPDSRSADEPLPQRSRDVVLSLFRHRRATSTVAFWVTSFMGLLLVYGLNTWLPQIMRVAGYPLGTALGLLLTLNLGGMIGMIGAGLVADRVGVRGPTITWFVAAAVLLALLSLKLPGAGLYFVVFVTGFFVFSAQVLVFAYVATAYGPGLRASGLGWTAGVGRLGAIAGPIIGGVLLDAGIAYPWGFYSFAAAGAFGAIAIVAVRTGRTVSGGTPETTPLPLA